MKAWLRTMAEAQINKKTVYGLGVITCPYCDKTVNVTTKFCPHCGKEVLQCVYDIVPVSEEEYQAARGN